MSQSTTTPLVTYGTAFKSTVLRSSFMRVDDYHDGFDDRRTIRVELEFVTTESRLEFNVAAVSAREAGRTEKSAHLSVEILP